MGRSHHLRSSSSPWRLVVVVLLGLLVPLGTISTAIAQVATPVVPTEAPEESQNAPGNSIMAAPANDPTGLVSRTASNLTPSAGEVVTFMVHISGSAPAGTRLELWNAYSEFQIPIVDNRILNQVNLSEPIPPQDQLTYFDVQRDGAYSATMEIDVRVSSSQAVGAKIPTSSQLNISGGAILGRMDVTLTVTAEPVAGTITVTPSSATPPAGSLVTFTVAIAGTAPANTALAVIVSYSGSALSVEGAPVIASSSNLSQPVHTPGTGTNLITFTVPEGGAFGATFTLDLRVAANVTTGTQIPVGSGLEVTGTGELASAATTLTVASMPGGPGPNPEPEPPTDALIAMLIAALIAALGNR